MSLVQGEGRIFEGGAADLILVKDVGVSPAQRLSQLSQADIELVLLRGQVMLASTLPASQLPPSVFGQMQRLLYSKKEFYVAADISRHWAETVVTLGDKFRLGGKEIRLRL